MKTYSPVIAQAHTPPYKIHKYFARRPWNVFEQMINTFTNESDIVLDPFCGGGVTIYEGLKLNRKVIGFDLNPLSIFIIKNMIKSSFDLNTLEDANKQIIAYLKGLYSDFNNFRVETSQKALFNTEGEVEWNELAFQVYCNFCGEKVILSNANKLSNGKYSCPNTSCKGNKNNGGYIEPKSCKRDGYKYLFSVISLPNQKNKVKLDFNNTSEQLLHKHLEFLELEISKNNIEIPTDKIPLDWDRQLEDQLEKKNIKTFQDLFTKRNLYINLLLKHFINNLQVNHDIKEVLRLIFSSSLRDTNIMAFTNEFWQSGNPTTWSKHAYWIPSQFCETNVIKAFEKAYERVKSAIVYNKQLNLVSNPVSKIGDLATKGNIFLQATSIAESEIPDNFVDAIITDPPYGSNVQYLELSHFWFVWNKDVYGENIPNFEKEAVSNRKKNFKGSKSMYDYERNLFAVFERCYKALKPNGYMALTFNNKDIGAWLAILISIFRSGFTFEKNGLFFQDGVKNYRQTAHTKYDGSPYGDFIYVFKKTSATNNKKNKFINKDEFIQNLDTLFSKHLVQFQKDVHDKNQLIISMFLEAIPIIEDYTKQNITVNENHSLYKHFNKDYLSKIYG